MSDVDSLQIASFYIMVGFPSVIAYAVVGLEWAVDIGTFVCAWWACWILWTEVEKDE
jgi:hypothetical protein